MKKSIGLFSIIIAVQCFFLALHVSLGTHIVYALFDVNTPYGMIDLFEGMTLEKLGFMSVESNLYTLAVITIFAAFRKPVSAKIIFISAVTAECIKWFYYVSMTSPLIFPYDINPLTNEPSLQGGVIDTGAVSTMALIGLLFSFVVAYRHWKTVWGRLLVFVNFGFLVVLTIFHFTIIEYAHGRYIERVDASVLMTGYKAFLDAEPDIEQIYNIRENDEYIEYVDVHKGSSSDFGDMPEDFHKIASDLGHLDTIQYSWEAKRTRADLDIDASLYSFNKAGDQYTAITITRRFPIQRFVIEILSGIYFILFSVYSYTWIFGWLLLSVFHDAMKKRVKKREKHALTLDEGIKE